MTSISSTSNAPKDRILGVVSTDMPLMKLKNLESFCGVVEQYLNKEAHPNLTKKYEIVTTFYNQLKKELGNIEEQAKGRIAPLERKVTAMKNILRDSKASQTVITQSEQRKKELETEISQLFETKKQQEEACLSKLYETYPEFWKAEDVLQRAFFEQCNAPLCTTFRLEEMFKCERCSTRYCSKACQTTDWPYHKQICKKVASESSQSTPSSTSSTTSQSSSSVVSSVVQPRAAFVDITSVVRLSQRPLAIQGFDDLIRRCFALQHRNGTNKEIVYKSGIVLEAIKELQHFLIQKIISTTKDYLRADAEAQTLAYNSQVMSESLLKKDLKKIERAQVQSAINTTKLIMKFEEKRKAYAVHELKQFSEKSTFEGLVKANPILKEAYDVIIEQPIRRADLASVPIDINKVLTFMTTNVPFTSVPSQDIPDIPSAFSFQCIDVSSITSSSSSRAQSSASSVTSASNSSVRRSASSVTSSGSSGVQSSAPSVQSYRLEDIARTTQTIGDYLNAILRNFKL